MAGPLSGIKIIELAGLGPAPYACMLLADAGAEVLCIDRPDPSADPVQALLQDREPLSAERRASTSSIKTASPWSASWCAEADIFIEGFRPGVTERLGLGPEELLAANPALVYGRMTGWGQEGALSRRAGHDINYISVAGALWAMGRADEVPSPPLNLVGDFGGGGMMLAFGVLAALLEAKTLGPGPGGRRSDGRRHGLDDAADLRLLRPGGLDRAASGATSSTRARTSTRSTRPLTAVSSRSAPSSPSSTPSCS